jgi:hypothetical protein
MCDARAAGSQQYNFAGVFGADPSGVSYSTGALTRALARADSPTITIPPGTYRLACSLLSSGLTAGSAVSFEGSGEGVSILRLDPACPQTAPLITWNGKSHVRLRNLTIDFNTPATPRTIQNGLAFLAYSGSASDLLVDHVALINLTSPVLIIGVAAAGGFTYNNITLINSYASLAAAATSQNECLGLTTVNGAGAINSYRVSGNICLNSGIQVDGFNGSVDHNDISGFKFGSAIFVAFETWLPKSSNYLSIDHNVIHDAPATCDVNGTPPAGVENAADGTTISGNLIHGLGGEGIRNYGRYTAITGNVIFDNGATGPGCGVLGAATQSGIHVGYARPGYDSRGVMISGNLAYDDGAGVQLYGYIDDPSVAGPITLSGNSITGVTQALKIDSAPGVVTSDWMFRQEVQALSIPMASLAFTALDTASYHRWRLSCSQLTPTIASAVGVQVGEGATPIWQTDAHYGVQATVSVGIVSLSYATNAGMAATPSADNWDATQSAPGLLTADFGDLAYAHGYRAFQFQSGYYKSGVGLATSVGTAAWLNDTNPVTAVRVIPARGNLYGDCRLEGGL